MLDLAMVQQCAPNTDPIVAHAIVKTESSFNPFAIGVNSGVRISQPKTYAQAVATAKGLLAHGHNIDLGWGQINSKNLGWLRLSVEEAFNPCSNLRAMQTVYNDCYARAGSTGAGTRMQRAFSCYNTGNFSRGFSNGYVNKLTRYYNQYQRLVAKAINKPSPMSNMPTAGGAELADYAAQLQQSSVSSKTDLQAPTSVSDASDDVSNVPFVAKATKTVIVENNSTVDTSKVTIHKWDIFADFTSNDF